MRQWLGLVIRDLPRYVSAFAQGGQGYLAIRNHQERLEAAPDGSGYRCDWQWTSDLQVPRAMPVIGRQLMRRALADHPVERARAPFAHSSENPVVTFIIGHRGSERLPHLLTTIQSIAAQRAVPIECVVVEQDTKSRLDGVLPPWVRHLFTPSPADMPYCRSWAFNVGVRYARGAMLVLHDNDLMVPVDYTYELVTRMKSGWQAINLKRFGFYLSQRHTERIFEGRSNLIDHPPEMITQNLEAGGSVAIARDAYLSIGGMDEGFVGWGGEDNEFWDRAQTLRVWPYGCLPYVHLWHPSQPGKYDGANPTLARYQRLKDIDARERIKMLLSISSGELCGPAGLTAGLSHELKVHRPPLRTENVHAGVTN